MKTLKKLTLLSLFILKLPICAFANDDGMNNLKMNGIQPPTREINPEAGPMIAGGWDVFITADYIYWKPQLDVGNLTDSATKTTTILDLPAAFGGTVTITSGNKNLDIAPDFDWRSGFKVGLGVNLPHDGWTLYAEYTWLRPDASLTLQSNPNPDLIGTRNFHEGDVFATLTDFVSTKVDFSHNNIDLTLGRNFYVSQYFTLMPYAGLKGNWQSFEQKTKIRNGLIYYQTIDVATGTGLGEVGYIEDVDLDTDVHADIWSIGIETGLKMGMMLVKNFSIVANLGVSQLFQTIDSDYKVAFTGLDNLTISGQIASHIPHISEGVHSGTNYNLCAIIEGYLGLEYSGHFSNDRYRLALTVGWETQWWGNWLEIPYENNQGPQHLAFQGLDVKFRFDF